MTISKLQPECIWKHFHSLTQIPRPSKNEEAASLFIKKFGKSLGLETIVDHVGNVIIRKPATPGMENCKGIVLQGHLDMVPQNNADTPHDWTKDPVETYIDGDWVRAKGTTLGADNGLGVATAMAILESKDLVHGPIEALFTIDEETGMTGAKELKEGVLKGEILINLDSEEEGVFYIGCAGGTDTDATFTFSRHDIKPKYDRFDLVVKGLRGGHSGMEINEGRANAIQLASRILQPILEDMDAELILFNGGSLRNAIPREATATIAIAHYRLTQARKLVKNMTAQMIEEFGSVEPNLKISFQASRCTRKPIDHKQGLAIVKSLLCCPNGVERMSPAMPGLVETSNNLAFVELTRAHGHIKTLCRSSIDSAKEALTDKIKAAFTLAGAEVNFSGQYSGWAPNPDSEIMETMKKCYNELYGTEPKIEAIHAGLECGILGGKYPNWDMISCGPTLMSPHSPDERVYIPSVGKFWEFIKHVLANAPRR